MFSIKRFLSVTLLLTVSMLSGCSKLEKKSEVAIDLFDVFKGKDLATNYLINVSNGNIEKANEACLDELVSSNINLSEGVSNLAGFQLDKTIAGTEFAYYIFNVVRDSNLEPKSDLESYTIKVNRNGDNYSISEVKAKPQRELYIKNNSLRIIGEKGGKSSLVISLNNIPKDTYLRENKIMVYKEKVPNNNFGKVVLGFTGEKIAISTVDDNNAFICIAYIDNTLMQNGTDDVTSGTASQGNQISELQEILEKPITSKVVPVDLLNNVQIENFIFSKEDDNIAVNYKDKSGIERLNIYKADDGSKISSKLDNTFNKDIYSVKAENFDGDKLIISVYKTDGTNDNSTGKYSLNIKSEEMIKL